MNKITDAEELRSLTEEGNQFGRQVKLYWESDTPLSPPPRFKDDPKVERERPHLLDMPTGVIGGGVTGVAEIEYRRGKEFKAKGSEEDTITREVSSIE